ncbi:MAG: PD-(D/E)XK nuclease-like domain-containing protein [Campylobacter sp.]|nr:PD-(D/E)XK nuclease-like domain-containing protein [Campylobacter sp.]
MTNKEYHARAEISKSDLDLLAKSPFHFKFKDEFEREESKALILGSAVHKLVLEPLDFEKEFIVEPQADKRTKAGREAYDEFLARLGDKTPLDSQTLQKAKEIAGKVNGAKQTALFLKDGLAEQSYFGQIEGVKVKCRPDFYNENLGLVVDLKTTSDASAAGFAKSVANFNYHIQAAFYSDILRQNGKTVNNFLFIAVETKKPYMVGFYELDNVAIEQGRESYLKLLELYKLCLKRNEWWGYSKFDGQSINAVQTLSLPAWKFYESVG